MIHPYYTSPSKDFLLANGDSFKLLKEFDFKFDMIFADPPYFLSNGGISLQSGKVVSVDKGEWDKGMSQDEVMAFNMEWLRLCRDKLKDNGSIWISGTYHNIFSVAHSLTVLGYKILNVVTWEKTNPPVNISCRYFKYSTEFIIWARKMKKVPHKFNYKLKGLTGETPTHFFMKYKLNKAAELLRSGKYNVSEVADLTGFGTVSHFSVSFKKHFGVNPKDYK